MDKNISFDELLEIAKSKLNKRKLSSMASAGTVAAAILTDKGNVYTGVCIDSWIEYPRFYFHKIIIQHWVFCRKYVNKPFTPNIHHSWCS